MAVRRTGGEVNILVARPDRMGDVILSTPVLEVLKQHYPNARITLMVRGFVRPIVEGLPQVDEVFEFDPEGKHRGVDGLFSLIREFRERKIRIGIVLHSNLKIAAALYGAGVPYRVGPLSKPHSYLFYNRGIRQRRSEIEMHETDYNLQLLRRLGIRTGSMHFPSRVSISEEARQRALNWLQAAGWNPDERLVVVHAGMGGSALNWPETHYGELVRALLREGKQVLLTGGPTEGDLVRRIEKSAAGLDRSPMVYLANMQDRVDVLGGLIQYSDVVVAPSTGPLHLAVALGKRVVAFYPPIKVQSALRWGPYTRNDDLARVLVPDVYCGQEFHCIGAQCTYYFCMRGIAVKQAHESVREHLAALGMKKNLERS